MSNEKENEMVEQSSSSDLDDFAQDLDENAHVPVDVRKYVISLGQAGIHGPEPIGSRTNNIEIIGPARTVRFT